MASKNTKLLVAAIDFGTTYSGWAFSFKHEYESEPTKVSGKNYYGGSHASMKAPTTILINPDGKTFDSFGYEAEDKYLELTGTGENTKWYYFSRFKMLLHRKIGLPLGIKLKDETHKKLSAMTVFSLAIRYLKDDLLKTSQERLTTQELRENEIWWVVTVPSIWTDAAKQFMREAAVEAGIKSENLKIALEPETASMFCCLLPVEQMVEESKIVRFQVGSKHMVIDAGGGTVDITVHEVLSGGKLKELQKSTGGAWGGTQVDEAYKKFINIIVGDLVYQRFSKEMKEVQLEMFRDFEIKKRSIAPNKDSDIKLRIPHELQKIFKDETREDLCAAIKKTKYAAEVNLVGDKLIVKASIMQSLFSNTIDCIISHVKRLFEDTTMREISSILMVGGFSESEMLKHAIKSNFPKLSVVVPRDAGLVVLKGAVIFGHSPSSIIQRVCKYTYGIEICVPFNNQIHDIMRRKEFHDGPYCTEVFNKHVTMGQIVAIDQCTEPQCYTPVTEDATSIRINIYASLKNSPLYVTDDGCVKLGCVKVSILDMSVPLEERSVLVTMTFGGTEIEVIAIEKRTGKATTATVHFLG
ncbi:hypothetical protein CHS0354_012742 [Potamilus streckersoni]|uniref:Uncharacterized protein n=1 Tax=Potamilus streckersoni TaxID=2493646 RepID=A0AAE0SXS6_9BIVA|nr:hypothetical protein CHS0354_012742 [Potamilus streckersoni]